MFNDWKTEVRADEDRQQQTLNCGGPREPYKGYPQSLAEAINRAKMVEKQVKQKRMRFKNQNEKETNLKRDRTSAELSNFALIKEQTNQPKGDKSTRLTYQEIRLLGKSAKASDHGFENCRYCEELKLDSNHIFINCDNNPRKKRSDSKRNNQRNLGKIAEPTNNNEDIIAKMEMAYNMGKNAKSDNSKSNEAELANFWRAIQQEDETEEYARGRKQFRFMMTARN